MINLLQRLRDVVSGVAIARSAFHTKNRFLTTKWNRLCQDIFYPLGKCKKDVCILDKHAAPTPYVASPARCLKHGQAAARAGTTRDLTTGPL